MTNQDHFHTKKELTVDNKRYSYYSLKDLQQQGHAIERLPFSIRVLLENALRNYDGYVTTQEHIETILKWAPKPEDKEIPFMPARVLMQDFTGVPAIVD